MRTKRFLVIAILFSWLTVNAQSDQEIALEKAREAIQMMDEGQIDESIVILEECEKLDPANFMYPYEIAYALVLKKEYNKAITVLERTKSYKNANSQVYQMSGNCHSWLGNPDKALEEYAAGLKVFPDAANLYLESGNIYYAQENYNGAVNNYRLGIEANPMFPSNYYNLAMLFFDSDDKLSGLIYGEIFMNIERDTERTRNMSQKLYEVYQEAIKINGDETSFDFCEIILTDENIKGKKLKMPFCGIFAKNLGLSLATTNLKEVNLSSISALRTSFISYFFDKDFKDYPNVLFEYQKQMLDDEVLVAYNHYIMQLGAPEAFELWRTENEAAYDQFISWYTDEKNYLQVNSKNAFIKL